MLAVVVTASCGDGEQPQSSPPRGAKALADGCRSMPGERQPGPPYRAGTLTAVEVGSHRQGSDRYDRVALTFACTVPEFRIEEPRRIERCCKPTVVKLRGRHLVELVFRGGQAHDVDADRWRSTVDRRLLRPVNVDLPVLRSYVLAEDWEGVMSIGFGLPRPAECWTAVRQKSDSETVVTMSFRRVSKRDLETVEARERRTACV